jgi:hypothetical protein
MKILPISSFLLLIFSLFAGTANSDIIIKENQPDAAPPKKDDAAAEEKPILTEPGELRSQVRLIIKNNEEDMYVGGVIKIKGAPPISDKEYLEVKTTVDQSATVATFHNIGKASYVFDSSDLKYISKDAYKNNPEAPEWKPVQCVLDPRIGDGKSATKNVTFIVGEHEGVMSCIVVYDEDI